MISLEKPQRKWASSRLEGKTWIFSSCGRCSRLTTGPSGTRSGGLRKGQSPCEFLGGLQLFKLTLGRNREVHLSTMTERLQDVLAKELHLPAVELIRCGGEDVMAAQREQWNDGSNTLSIAPGRVITYERNYVTNDLLDKKGIDVITIPSSELSRGRGGPRCMSCPVYRDDI